MEGENYKTISIADFQAIKEKTLYVDDDFVLTDELGTNYHSAGPMKLDCSLLVLCLEGCVQIDVNNRTHQLNPGDLYYGTPNSFFSHLMASPDHKVRVVGFSTRFMQQNIRFEQRTWNAAMYIHEHPIIHIGDNDLGSPETFFNRNGSLFMMRITNERHPYYKEMMRHMFTALFYEIYGYTSLLIERGLRAKPTPEATEPLKSSSFILRKFVEILAKDNGVHRSVAYYADAVCYTPKYFSKVIKQAYGKSPLEMINQNAIEHIKFRLKNSQKSIKEISEEFQFPNQSFFGKYVKAHTGMSPKQYRES